MKKYTVMKKTICAVLAALALFGLWRRESREVPAFRPARLPGATLIIDAGHGGEDGGAVSGSGTVESHINLAIALRVGALMDLYGIDHLLLRESDRSLHDEGCDTLRKKKVSDLHNRVAVIESTPQAVVMSIHQNIFSNSRCHGAQVFYAAHPESLSFAQFTQSALRAAVDPNDRRVPAAIAPSVYLMNHITCPAILVECGFLSNPEEEALLTSAEYQTKLAAALTAAYIAYQESTEEEFLYESS